MRVYLRALEASFLTTQTHQVLWSSVSIVSFGLFLRERSRRTAQLVRMDRECAISDLGVSFTADMTGATKTFQVRELREKLRLLVVYGDKDIIRKAVLEAAVYRRRFLQVLLQLSLSRSLIAR